jgi:hypothetical protein
MTFPLRFDCLKHACILLTVTNNKDTTPPKKHKAKAKQHCAERESKEETVDIFQTTKAILLKESESEFLQHEVDVSSKRMVSVTEMKMIRVPNPLKTHKIHQ